MNLNSSFLSSRKTRLAITLTASLTLLHCAHNAKQTITMEPAADSVNLNEHQQKIAEGVRAMGEGRLTVASDAFNQALKMKPTEGNYHLLNAMTYHLEALNGNAAAFDLAREGYQIALKFEPSNWVSYYMLGRLELDIKDYPRARAMFAEALLLEKNEPMLLRGMAYAAYLTGDAEMAASMITQLEKRGELKTWRDYQNAALVYAAVGEKEKSDTYFQKLEKSSDAPPLTADVRQRVDSWNSLYAAPALTPVQWGGGGGSTGWGNTGGSWGGGSTNNASGTQVAAKDMKMVVVDVVIIRTSEVVSNNQGFNLLKGLQVQFGSNSTPAWGSTKAIVRNENGGSQSPQAVDSLIRGETETITSSISVPSLTYSLNIFNTNSQRNEILARPTIVAMSSQRSEFFSGVELNAAAVSAGGSNGVGQPVQIQKEIGVKLGVTPSFLDDGRIQLSVQAERTFLNSPNDDVNFTFKIETSKTNVNANVVMRFGETLILSGLSEKETEKSRDGVPFLQDIPIIQYFFSEKRTKEFQNSVLILLTPRPAQYVYQPEKARQEFESSLTEDERPIANLRARYSDWFQPYPNWASVFNHMQSNGLYREFRTGDVELESWTSDQTLPERMKRSLQFLYY